MSKYINADDWSYDSTITQAKFTNISDVLSYFNGLYGKNKSVDQMIEKLEIDLINMPSADVVEVKHGKWIEEPSVFPNHPFVRCSECGEEALLDENGVAKSNFCPLCGADMRGKTK